MDVILRAVQFAQLKHHGQVRRYTGEPYFTHCVDVARVVASVVSDESMIVAALLHDTVEDTSATLDEIQAEFGDQVADLVGWLTNEPAVAGLNRARRKTMDRERLARAPWQAQTIKLADMICNAPSLRDHDPEFAVKWSTESRALVAALGLGDIGLRGQLLAILGNVPQKK